MDKTYLFYDLETTGLNKCFDQVLQFAAIRTDLALHELERHNFFIKLNPDTIPSPKAAITHRISLKDLAENGISEFAAISKIHKLLNEPNTISIGYNSLGFDDEFLRFSFYRNLLPPYTHQYNNGCSRADLYPITIFYYLFKNEILAWPKSGSLPTFKLEHLNTANNLCKGSAHDALVDTEIALELARRLIKEKAIWDFVLGYFIKNLDLKRTEQLPKVFSIEGHDYQEGILIDPIFSGANHYQALVLNLGVHNHYKNQFLWLRTDNENLLKSTPESIPETTNIYRKKIGELGLLLAPIPKTSHYLNEERLKLTQENKLWLQKNPKLLKAITNYYRDYKYPVISNIDLDAMLYQKGFLSVSEEKLCRKFHVSDINSKLTLAHELPNNDLKNQMIRVLGRNYREFLSDKIAKEFDRYLENAFISDQNQALIDYRGLKRLTTHAALAEITNLKTDTNLDKEQHDLLIELENHILRLQK